MKLRDVDIIISGTKTGDTYYAKSYPCSDMDKNSKIDSMEFLYIMSI